MIPFNKPYFSGKELDYIREVIQRGKVSGDGAFTRKCHEFFEKRYGFQKCLLTTSCTDALEMAAILLKIQPGDEVIIPSYTFASTANAFVLRGAKIVFCDSRNDHPGINEDMIEALITSKTKVIVAVHYAGVACDMDKIMILANKYNLYVVEDAAQAIDSYYTNAEGLRKPLGSIGHLAAFSFHESKNIISGEGGMLVINDAQFIERAEIIWEKGTTRSKFFRGEVEKYEWVDVGSSFLPSEIIAAFLYAQLELLDEIQEKRKKIWQYYYNGLKTLADKDRFRLPLIPRYATNNAHMFYIIFHSLEERSSLMKCLKEKNIISVFHYLSLHSSPLHGEGSTIKLPFSDLYKDRLLRLPFYYELDTGAQDRIIKTISS